MATVTGLFASLTDSVTTTLKEVRQLKDTIVGHEKSIDKLNMEVSALNINLQKEQSTVKELNAEIGKRTVTEKKFQEQLVALESAKASLESNLKEAEKSLQLQKEDNDALAKDIAAKQKRMKKA
jgi:chromosome segregation ATPase